MQPDVLGLQAFSTYVLDLVPQLMAGGVVGLAVILLFYGVASRS